MPSGLSSKSAYISYIVAGGRAEHAIGGSTVVPDATANGHTGTILDPAWIVTPLALVTSSGASNYIASSNPYGAVPNAVEPSGRSFTVSFRPSFRGTVPASPLAGAPLPEWIR